MLLQNIFSLINSGFFFLHFLSLLKYRCFNISHIVISQLTAISFISFICYLLLYQNQLIFECKSHTIYLIRYLEWFLTTPLQLLILSSLLYIEDFWKRMLVFCDLSMIITGLLGDIFQEINKWISIVFMSSSIIFYSPIFIFIFYDFNFKSVFQIILKGKNEPEAYFYYFIGKYLLLVWILYPIFYFLTYFKIISTTQSFIFYCLSDLLAKLVFSRWIFHVFCYSLDFPKKKIIEQSCSHHDENDDNNDIIISNLVEDIVVDINPMTTSLNIPSCL